MGYMAEESIQQNFNDLQKPKFEFSDVGLPW